MCSDSIIVWTDACSYLDREKQDDKLDLEKRTAQVSQRAEISFLKENGIVCSGPMAKPKKDGDVKVDDDAKVDDEVKNVMWLEATELEKEESLREHISDVLSHMCVEHQQCFFACFQIAIGSGNDIRMPSTKKQNKHSIHHKTRKSAAFTGGSRRYSA